MLNLSCENHEALVPVVKRPEYTISLEQINPDTTFVHCTILVPWTGRVRRDLQDDVERLYSLHGGPLHARIPSGNPKLERFARLMGAEHVAYLTDLMTGQTDLIFKR